MPLRAVTELLDRVEQTHRHGEHRRADPEDHRHVEPDRNDPVADGEGEVAAEEGPAGEVYAVGRRVEAAQDAEPGRESLELGRASCRERVCLGV